MDVRTISGAAFSRPPTAVTPADIASPLDETKGSSSAAPYLSPVYHFDPVAKLAILSYRDPSSGDVTAQIPSEKVVEQYRRTRGDSPDATPTKSVTSAKASESTAPRETAPVPTPPESSSGGSGVGGISGKGIGASSGGSSSGGGDGAVAASTASSGDVRRVSLSV